MTRSALTLFSTISMLGSFGCGGGGEYDSVGTGNPAIGANSTDTVSAPRQPDESVAEIPPGEGPWPRYRTLYEAPPLPHSAAELSRLFREAHADYRKDPRGWTVGVGQGYLEQNMPGYRRQRADFESLPRVLYSLDWMLGALGEMVPHTAISFSCPDHRTPCIESVMGGTEMLTDGFQVAFRGHYNPEALITSWGYDCTAGEGRYRGGDRRGFAGLSTSRPYIQLIWCDRQ